jgi:hypothetical protein
VDVNDSGCPDVADLQARRDRANGHQICPLLQALAVDGEVPVGVAAPLGELPERDAADELERRHGAAEQFVVSDDALDEDADARGAEQVEVDQPPMVMRVKLSTGCS